MFFSGQILKSLWVLWVILFLGTKTKWWATWNMALIQHLGKSWQTSTAKWKTLCFPWFKAFQTARLEHQSHFKVKIEERHKTNMIGNDFVCHCNFRAKSKTRYCNVNDVVVKNKASICLYCGKTCTTAREMKVIYIYIYIAMK